MNACLGLDGPRAQRKRDKVKINHFLIAFKKPLSHGAPTPHPGSFLRGTWAESRGA